MYDDRTTAHQLRR